MISPPVALMPSIVGGRPAYEQASVELPTLKRATADFADSCQELRGAFHGFQEHHDELRILLTDASTAIQEHCPATCTGSCHDVLDRLRSYLQEESP